MKAAGLNYSSLAAKAGVAPNTVKYCHQPGKRPGADSKSAKTPSANMGDLEKIATALGLELADLVTDRTDAERIAILRKRAAAHYEAHGVLPEWAPDKAA